VPFISYKINGAGLVRRQKFAALLFSIRLSRPCYMMYLRASLLSNPASGGAKVLPALPPGGALREQR
jgi:hypothetical protein